ncbi:signal peptidase I [Oceanobacillus kimchii]|uniref:signal peptidase I n=1 Tax=Oceanobacillus TaxID=182709 RepID=UPI00034882AB|nr:MULTISPECIES: signal peptidase I [Oceanobacillus]MCT1576441.1 signal peptidase I [Oceanobacillus kimchii]MCT2136077.1 signal peptidase I [Oceanobacillus kimchii]OEH54504.1 S26 family signal peptidase [Oceanobacillus sp. E9]
MTNKKDKNEWVSGIKAIVLAIIVALFLRTFIFATSIVEGESMAPTLENGERVIFNKVVYMLDEPDRGDIVIIHQPPKNYVKRIIGLPGEEIEIKDHQLYINGDAYTQSFLSKDALYATSNFGPIIIPEENYFVMGDNRLISKDSRNGLGYIPKEDIIGKSELIIYPFNELGRTN